MFAKKLIAAGLLTIAMGAQAGVVVGGSTLINNAAQTQLEAWLGEGELTLTNIFTKSDGKTGVDFHAAADGKGRTFSLMTASEDGGQTWKTIGGYNPQNWISAYSYTVTPNQNDWTAFLFNLTDGVKLDQTDATQTYNGSHYGPVFGSTHDLFVDYDLSIGYSFAYSYGNVTPGSSLVDGSYYSGLDMLIGKLEVFTVGNYIAPTQPVPEPASFLLMGLGLLGVAAARRKMAAKAA
jgi:hypothetical protein